MITRSFDLLWRHWDYDVVVFDERSGATHLLNPFSATVLSLLQEPSTINLLARRTAELMSIPCDEELLSGIDRALGEFSKLGLVASVS